MQVGGFNIINRGVNDKNCGSAGTLRMHYSLDPVLLFKKYLIKET